MGMCMYVSGNVVRTFIHYNYCAALFMTVPVLSTQIRPIHIIVYMYLSL